MCGGVIFPYKKEYRQALEQYYSPQQIEEFERSGQVRSLYWQKGEPVLPVLYSSEEEEQEQEQEQAGPHEDVLRWGNRDKEAPFPKTGWARIDSIESGRWSYLHPQPVLIPVTHG